ncbi:hypothetical protein [Brevifollis gellanilyticus]|uniref:hypothetical protein n=1 Tax=Brevifollis gellanilyticus TaxID=748831 RepID=UPI0015802E1B|nr:hypothetical protein [Brevifollis gellanilyticus]
MKPLFQRSASAWLGLALVTSAQAQQQPAPVAPNAPVAAPASAVVPPPAPAPPPAPPPPDPKVIKEREAILSQKFSRDPNDLLRHLERLGTADPATLSITDRFSLRFITGDWAKVRDELTQMPPELARKIFDKMLSDLTENRKPNTKLEDVLGIADAVPGELTGDNLRRLGQLMSVAVPLSESYWLVDRLKKGTRTLGGTDPAKRLAAARMLIAGNFKDLARTYLPPVTEIDQLTDEGLKNDLRNFLTTQEERENAQRDQVMSIWDENIAAVISTDDSKAKGWEKSKASNAIAKVITQVPVNTIGAVLADVTKTNPEGAMRLVSAFTRKVQSERNNDVPTRTENLAAQATLANLLAGLVKPGEQPWSQISEMMADHWASEADYTYQQKLPNNQNNQGRFIAPEELLAAAPAGSWFEALPQGVRDRIDVSVSRLILTGAQFDQAAERIVEIGKRSPAAGAALAEDFLTIWGKTHNPQLPEQLRKRYNLPDDARIPVTPIMMEKNIESLARMMTLFRNAGLAPKDYASVVTAFDLAYSTAETYKTSHIEKVFGPMARMDEPVFSLILSRMNSNLGERWRKMDVQRSGMTQRDETETLEMVRSGYSTALQLIDGWLAGHPESWRALTLAGTLLVDWGDFEYFQELVANDPQQRMFGFKEKNLQAQDYFSRGAVAYARLVPKLTVGEYTVEPHLAWFNALLGIGSNNQLNLSKPMNRAALTKIREQLAALPGKAAKAHISLFAKIVNARLTDEKDPLHEDLKYRYLASAMVITKDDPFTLGVAKKLTYFDELLSEVRLQTRVDGPNTVGRDQDFGIIVSIIHSEAMGRAAKFGQYLSNDSNAGGSKGRQGSAVAHKMGGIQGARDELEMNLTQALTPFFDIKSITFATPDIKPRPTAQTGWEETVLAYLHVRAKDASVDKIPPVEMQFKFIDMTGPVSIPAESAETVIKVATEGAAPRPASHVDITQTLDNRQLPINGTLSLEIKATATGLVPDLEQLLSLDPKAVISVKNTNPHEGLQIKELNTWSDEVVPTSERLWTLTLDGDAVRAAEGPVEFRFPSPKVKDATVTYQTYKDMNLTTLTEPLVTMGQPAKAAEIIAHPASHPYPWIIGAAVAVIGIGVILVLSRKRGGEQPLRAKDVFHMPADLDGFAVIALLRKLRGSPLVKLKDNQRQELQGDLQRIEQGCFGAQSPMPEADLRSIAAKWLRCAS